MYYVNRSCKTFKDLFSKETMLYFTLVNVTHLSLEFRQQSSFLFPMELFLLLRHKVKHQKIHLYKLPYSWLRW